MPLIMGRLLPKASDEAVDYGPLMGFGSPHAVPVNPHNHVAQPPKETNLSEVVEILRAKQAAANAPSAS